MKLKPTIAEIEAALEEFGQDHVGFGPDGELVIHGVPLPPLPPPQPARLTTHTYSTTNIVILDGFIYAEDFSHTTTAIDVPERVWRFVDRDHVRKFGEFEGDGAMHHLTMWLHEISAVVDECWILGPELSDAERQT